MSLELLKEVLHSGIWATIGPYSQKAAEALASHMGAKHCLMLYSGSMALEVALCALGVCQGDVVLVPASAEKIVRLSPNLAGAKPIECGGEKTGPTDIKAALVAEPLIKCVVLDANVVSGLEETSRLLSSRGVPLIIWAGGQVFSGAGRTLTKFCDFAVYTFSEGSDIYAGCGGALLTDEPRLFHIAYALHNCGRTLGEEASVFVDKAVGGNLRITEWQAAIIYSGLKNQSKE